MLTRKQPLRRATGEARASVPVFRARTCQVKRGGCGCTFTPTRQGQIACSPDCALSIGGRITVEKARKEARAERVADRAKREKLKSSRELKPEAQDAFNAYIRYRDRNQPCIDCGKPFEVDKLGGSVDAGHFRSIGSAPHMRFIEDNVFAQRKNCNMPGGTTSDAFKAGVIARIGVERTEAVLADQTVRQYRADDYRRIRDEYRAKLRELKKAAE